MTLIERQIELEERYTSEGILRTLHQWEADIANGRIADTSIGRAVTVRCFALVRGELEKLVNAGTRGVGGKYRSLIKEIGIDIAAIVALRTALSCNPIIASTRNHKRDNHGHMPIVQDFISYAASALELEFMVKKLVLAAPRYTDKVVRSLKEANSKSISHRTRTFRKTADNVGVGADRVMWDNTTRIGVGKVLLKAAVDAGVVETYELPKSFYQHMIGVKLTTIVEDKLDKMVHYMKASILFPPSLVPPRLHTKDDVLVGSSYLTADMYGRAPSVVLKYRNKERRAWVQRNITNECIDAANKSAQVPYLLDIDIMKRLRVAASKIGDEEIAGIPGSAPIKPPQYPLGEGWDRDNPTMQEIHEEWKHRAKEAYIAEIERKSKLLQFHLCMKYMDEFKNDVLYFPTFLDWRGRLYFRTRINPQGADFVKACIKFQESKPLGKEGLYWLKVHVATCFGFDKAHFDTRAAWVDKNLEAIRIAVEDDIDSEFFLAADSPWCFLAAARDYLNAIDSGNPETYCSQIPVAMDATCSGLQVLSALLRDPVGGLMVNLLPNNGVEKEDIYAAVAAIAISNIQKDTDNLEMAKYWRDNGVPRSMAKRPVNVIWRV